jgi:prophage antirepressor-like protein
MRLAGVSGRRSFSLQWNGVEMSSALLPYIFDGANVRAVVVAGEPWFVAKDVASVLGYSNSRKAVSDHCKAARPVGGNGSLPLDPQTTIIPERDLYRLVMRSKLPGAERFEEWVVGDVLPSIRRIGSYQVAAPAIPRTLAQALRLAADQADQLEQQRPAVEFVERYVESDSTMGFREMAKLLGAREGAFKSFLLERRIMYRLAGRLAGYAPHLNAGRLIERVVMSEDKSRSFNECRFTAKGVTWVTGLWHRR